MSVKLISINVYILYVMESDLYIYLSDLVFCGPNTSTCENMNNNINTKAPINVTI